MLKQISIFAENKKGMLQSVTGILARENINIMGSVTNDSAEYGIIRMVVSDPQRALEALSKEGFICRDTDVLGVELDDNPGALDRLLVSLFGQQYQCGLSIPFLQSKFGNAYHDPPCGLYQ